MVLFRLLGTLSGEATLSFEFLSPFKIWGKLSRKEFAPLNGSKQEVMKTIFLVKMAEKYKSVPVYPQVQSTLKGKNLLP